MGFPELLTGVGFLLPPQTVGLLGQATEHRVGIHLPEHPGFAKAAGFGVGQGLGFQQHHITDAAARQGSGAAEASHATSDDDDGRLVRQRGGLVHAASPKLRPMGSVAGAAATSFKAAPTDRP